MRTQASDHQQQKKKKPRRTPPLLTNSFFIFLFLNKKFVKNIFLFLISLFDDHPLILNSSSLILSMRGLVNGCYIEGFKLRCLIEFFVSLLSYRTLLANVEHFAKAVERRAL